MTTSESMDTGKVKERRTLHFKSLDEALTDADTLASAERAAKLRALGNWSLGQSFNHLSSWVDYSFEGAPLKIPLIIRLMLRPMKKRFIYKPMKAGGNIPKVPGGTLAINVVPLEEGLAHLHRSFGRLKNESPAIPHMLFGPLTHDEWINQHLRHAELHLSFYRTD